MRTVPEGEAKGRRRRRRRSRSEGGRGGTEENHTTSKLTVGKIPSSLRIPDKKSHRKLNRATFDIISAPVRSRVGFVKLKVLQTILLDDADGVIADDDDDDAHYRGYDGDDDDNEDVDDDADHTHGGHDGRKPSPIPCGCLERFEAARIAAEESSIYIDLPIAKATSKRTSNAN